MSRKSLSKAEAITDLQRVARELDRAPTYIEYTERGQYHAATLRIACQAKWNDVLVMAGFVPRAGGRAADGRKLYKRKNSDLLNDVLRVAREIGHQPTSVEYRQKGVYSRELVIRRFGGTWQGVIEAAGLEYKKPRLNKLTDRDLRADLERVMEIVGHLPTHKEYLRHGKYSHSPLSSSFDHAEGVIDHVTAPAVAFRHRAVELPTPNRRGNRVAHRKGNELADGPEKIHCRGY